jgi:serine protease AprX
LKAKNEEDEVSRLRKKWLSLLTAVALVIGSMAGVSANPSGKSPERVVPLPIIADLNKNKIFDNLEEKLQQAKDTQTFDTIVMFNETVNAAGYASLEQKIGAFSTKFKYENAFHGFAGTLTKGQILALQRMPLVKQVELDMPVEAFVETASHWFGTTKAQTDFGLTGNTDGTLTSYSKNDVVVAVIDTGIDGTHVDLDEGKVIGWKDFVNGKTTTYDDNGHGTHVAGITAGSGDGNSAYRGVAYGAALVGIKVLDRNGSGTMSTVDAGIDWAIQNKSTYNIRAINLSLGTSGSSDGTDSTSTAVNNAAANGIIPLVAAGNSGPAKYTIGSPGAAEDAITIAAMADVGELGFNIAYFSSRGPTKDGRIKPDVGAPGYKITAPQANSENGYVTYSGTSMATPFTAGVVALMLEANGSLSPNDVKLKLIGTAQDWGPTGKDIDYGAGRLQAYEAIKSAGGYSGTGPTVPNHGYGSGTLSGTGDVDNWSLGVNSTAYPISTVLIIKDWKASLFGGKPDFDLYVYDPNGNLVGKSEGTKRQETVSFNPTVTGTYTIKVYSYSGKGDYFLDISYK